jgi:hypothetical protein
VGIPQELSPPLQAEALDFIEYLLAKAERREKNEWSELSLRFAIRGIEDEEAPTYTAADLKVKFP